MNKILRFALLAAVVMFANFADAQYLISGPDKGQSDPLDCATEGMNPDPNFEDGGGAYSPNMDETFTVCPDLNQATKVSVVLNTQAPYVFDIHPSDTLYIFDGLTTSSPLIAAINSNVATNGGTYDASFENNPSGCLTFRFKSDAANEAEGWSGKLGCGMPPQPFEMHLEAFVEGSTTTDINPIDTGWVDVCKGDSILLVAKPVFPYAQESTGYGYQQNVNDVDYEWNISGIGDLPNNNDSIWFVPNQHQGYFITVKVTDQFPQSEVISARVRVGMLPVFNTGGPLEDTVCVGTETILIGGVSFTDTAGVDVPGGSFSVGGSYAGLTPLPDGAGLQYQTTINISGMGGGTVTSPNDISSICLDIEHSWLNDLEIAITCPNGTMASLMNTYNGGLITGGCSPGGVFLGNDTGIDDGAPGQPPLTYCFSFVNPDFGTVCSEYTTNTFENAYGNESLIPGTYTPDGNFNSLIGCPLDGNWTITVRDNLNVDDGYIFEWGITFDAELYPNHETYQNYLADSYWTPAPTITAQTDTSITVLPNPGGIYYYTFNVVDDYGCHYDTTYRVVTIQNPVIFNDTFACDLHYQVAGTLSYGGGNWFAEPAGLNFSNPNAINPNITASDDGTYTVSFVNAACQDTVSSQIYFPPLPDIFNDTVVCGDEFQVFGTVSDPGGGTWSAFFPDVSFSPVNGINPVISATASGVYQVTYTDDICGNTATSTITMYLLPEMFNDTFACHFEFDVNGIETTSGGVWSSADTNIHFAPGTGVDNPIINSTMPGQYEVTFTDNQCQVSFTRTIDFIDNAFVTTYDTIICENAGMVPMNIWAHPQNDSYVWSNGETGTTVHVMPGQDYIVTVSNECNSYSSTMHVGSKVCDIEVPNVMSLSSQVGNDKFYLSFNGVKKLEMTIVDKWGNVVCEINDPTKAWDGKDLSGKTVTNGVYFYTIVAEMETGESLTKQGFVQVYE